MENIMEHMDMEGGTFHEPKIEDIAPQSLNVDQDLIDIRSLDDFSNYLRVEPMWSRNHDNFKYADLR